MILMIKNLPSMQETQVQSLGWEDPLKKGMVTHSSVLAWRVPIFLPEKLYRGAWRGGSWRVRHNWATTTFTFKDIQDKLSSRQLYIGAWRAGPRSVLAIWICEPLHRWYTCHSPGFPGGASGKEPACLCRRHKRCRFNPWVGKIPWRRAWQSSPVFLPAKFHGQRNLVGYIQSMRS